MAAKSSPPFSALRAIEAVSRHRNYTWAAKELDVTHSAVSQAVKRLEGQLGTRLFERRGAAMEPSPAALQLAKAYADAASVIHRSLEDIAQLPPPNRLTVAMPSDFGRLWFAPRLSNLSTTMPDLAVDIRTQMAGADWLDDCDLSIRVGLPRGVGWKAETLFDPLFLPICSPAFAARYDFGQPQDVLRVPLLALNASSWEVWLRRVGVTTNVPPPTHVFDDVVMLLESCARGDGLALAPEILAATQLKSGALVTPIEIGFATGETMLAVSRGTPESPELVTRFLNWLKDEIAADYVLARSVSSRPNAMSEQPVRSKLSGQSIQR